MTERPTLVVAVELWSPEVLRGSGFVADHSSGKTLSL